MSSTLRWMIWPLIGFSFLCGSLSAGCQNEPGSANSAANEKGAADSRAAPEGATIRGIITAAESSPFEFDLTTLPVTITEHVVYKPLPLPPDWGTRTDEQRDQWVKEFQETDAGKEFFAEREARLKNQRRFQVELEADGSFEVYDVPAGNYNLFGRKNIEVAGKNYAVEVFGQIELQDVDELVSPPLPIAVTRLLSVGEAAPDFSVDSLANAGNNITLAQYQGRPILVYFWTMKNPPVEDETAMLKKTYEVLGPELKLELLAICVDETVDKAVEFITARQLTWPQGGTAGWKHPVFADYGLRAIPASFLIGGDGKLLLTNAEFFREFTDPSRDLTTVIREKVTGAGNASDK